MFNLKKAVAYGPDIGLPKFTVAFFDAIDAFFGSSQESVLLIKRGGHDELSKGWKNELQKVSGLCL